MYMDVKFSKSNKLRNKLLAAQYKQMKQWFRKAYRLIQEKIASTGLKISNGNLTAVEVQKLKSLLKFIVKSYSELIPKIEDGIKEDMYVLTDSIAQEGKKKTGVTIDKKELIMSVVTGAIYDSNWTLHKAVAHFPKEIQKLIETIIQDGISEGKSVDEITKTILSVLDPDATESQRSYKAKSGTVYTGAVYSNVHRITVTTIVHDYQQAVIAVANQLPGTVYIRWISALAPNTCELCEQRHNQLFEPADVPLEHPNGQCELEIVIM